ncbi:hypothetical protein CR513_33172, partial [Mucuna pruriens]
MRWMLKEKMRIKAVGAKVKRELIQFLRDNRDMFAWRVEEILVTYPTWLANVVIVKKSSGAWRICTDYTNPILFAPRIHTHFIVSTNLLTTHRVTHY